MRTKNLRRLSLLAAGAALTFAAVGCQPPAPSPNQATPNASASPSPADTASPHVANPDEAALQKFVGKWKGPEGTYLLITDKPAAGKQQNPRVFDIEIADLDGPKKFTGEAKGREITFTRNGKVETIKSATGAETGMKGFEKEVECVVVTKGSEGFCGKSDAKPAASPAAPPAASPIK